jgi:hypothetical protein
MDEPEGLAEWAVGVPEVMRNDPIWRLPAYRYSLFLGDLLQQDVKRMRGEIRQRRLVAQLLDAVESISANIAEGYSRTSGPERARFFEVRAQLGPGGAGMAVQGAACALRLILQPHGFYWRRGS